LDFIWKTMSNAWRGNERRKSPRHATDQPIRIVLPARGSTIHGILQDLSETGCCVVPDEPFLLWNSIRVEIRFEADQTQFRLAGMTRGSRGGKSFGVEFDSMSAEKVMELRLLLPKRKMPEKIVRVEVSLADPEGAALIEDGQETTGEETSSPDKAKKFSKFAGIVRVEKPPGGRERRVHDRYLMEAQAVLLVVKTGETVSGYVLEMSESGCRVYLDHACEMQLGTHVEVNFSLHGIPVRMAGVNQVRMNSRTVGIHFFELSGRKKSQMVELIAEIREAIARSKSAQ
jgi:hypothetical protein